MALFRDSTVRGHCRTTRPVYARSCVYVIASMVLLLVCLVVWMRSRGSVEYQSSSWMQLEQTQDPFNGTGDDLAAKKTLRTDAQLPRLTEAEQLTNTPRPASTPDVSVVLNVTHGSSQITITPERVPTIESLSNVYLSILTIPRFHSTRFSFQLMTWLQTFNPVQVHTQPCLSLLLNSSRERVD